MNNTPAKLLIDYWFNSIERKAVWALFDTDGTMVSWSVSKREARKIMNKRFVRPLWIARISA